MIKLILSFTAIFLALQSTRSSAGTIQAGDLSASFHSSFNTNLAEPDSKGWTTDDAQSAAYIPSLGEPSHTRIELICSCKNALSGESRRIGVLTRNDRLHTSIYVPMRRVNNALSLVGTTLQTQLSDSLVTLVQAVSLVSRRKVNAEITYEVDVNSYSRVASSLVYRLHPGATSGNSDVVASLTYSAHF